jgi:rhamnosyl/mannosyltransferase
MRILFVVSELPPIRSGVARIAAQLLDGYRAAGHEVEVVERRATGEVSLGEVRLSGLALRWSRFERRLDRCDLVHLHGPAPTFADVVLLGLALRRGRRPPVLYSHNFELHFPGPLAPLARLYEVVLLRLAGRVASRIVVATEQVRSRLPRPEAAVVVPWGSDHRALREGTGASCAADGSREPPPEAPPEDRALRVLFVGQMRPYKGVPVLLEALRGVPGIAARLAGGGRRLSAYRRLLARRGGAGSGSIELLGPVAEDELDRLYAWADVVTLPSTSRQEAFGLVLVEGMGAGCVPVASRLPGVDEVVGDAGILVDPGDAGALRRALVELRDDASRRAELSRRARLRAGRQRWEDTVSRHLELARAVVAETKAARPEAPERGHR